METPKKDTLDDVVLRARALVRLRDDARKMESQKMGAIAMDNYLKAVMRFVDDVSGIRI